MAEVQKLARLRRRIMNNDPTPSEIHLDLPCHRRCIQPIPLTINRQLLHDLSRLPLGKVIEGIGLCSYVCSGNVNFCREGRRREKGKEKRRKMETPVFFLCFLCDDDPMTDENDR